MIQRWCMYKSAFVAILPLSDSACEPVGERGKKGARGGGREERERGREGERGGGGGREGERGERGRGREGRRDYSLHVGLLPIPLCNEGLALQRGFTMCITSPSLVCM